MAVALPWRPPRSSRVWATPARALPFRASTAFRSNVATPLTLRHTALTMCRNIKPLFNFDPPATEDEVRAASLQFVRKLSGFNKPSSINERVFNDAVEAISAIAGDLIGSLVTLAPPKNRELEAEKRRVISARRFGPR